MNADALGPCTPSHPPDAADPVEVEVLRLEKRAWNESSEIASRVRKAIAAWEFMGAVDGIPDCKEFAALSLAIVCSHYGIRITDAINWIREVENP
jgi:hypothetical protein